MTALPLLRVAGLTAIFRSHLYTFRFLWLSQKWPHHWFVQIRIQTKSICCIWLVVLLPPLIWSTPFHLPPSPAFNQLFPYRQLFKSLKGQQTLWCWNQHPCSVGFPVLCLGRGGGCVKCPSNSVRAAQEMHFEWMNPVVDLCDCLCSCLDKRFFKKMTCSHVDRSSASACKHPEIIGELFAVLPRAPVCCVGSSGSLLGCHDQQLASPDHMWDWSHF